MTVTRRCNGVIGVKYRLTPESSKPRRMIENHGEVGSPVRIQTGLRKDY